VALNALAILERPPVADHFFDGMGSVELGAKYRQKKISAENIIDCGERTQFSFPPILATSILHQKWALDNTQRL
jgi:hypothetical protein